LRTDLSSSEPPSLDYVARVNRAIDYILENLERPLRLEEVARSACFSPFHFHRVFHSILGETLGQFVKRVRLERALRMLSHQSELSLTEVALACGFGSPSDFSRSFKQHYGVPPSLFDVSVFRERRRQDWQAAIEDPVLRHRLDRLPPGENPDDFEVRVRHLPSRRVAYVRVLDPYRPDAVVGAAERLVAWARERGLEGGQWLGYMWDDPEIVAHPDCRYDVGVEVTAAEPEGEVGVIDFPETSIAEVELRGAIDLEMRALDWLWGTWLPNSGYVPTDQPCFEAWIGLPFAHGTEHFELRLQIPVERG
jgi:AraC family transcriptional regulator